MSSVTSIEGVMDALSTVAEGPVAAALQERTGRRPQVRRYRPRRPNTPAVWHERRPSRAVEPDISTVRDVLTLAVILAVRHGEEDVESLPLEQALDDARAIYDDEARGRYPLGGVHRLRRVALEAPTPTLIDDVPLLTSGVVLEIQIERRPARRA